MSKLATAVHEISHVLACWLTCGGSRLKCNENAGGVTHYHEVCLIVWQVISEKPLGNGNSSPIVEVVEQPRWLLCGLVLALTGALLLRRIVPSFSR
jgi:hypothetical protein